MKTARFLPILLMILALLLAGCGGNPSVEEPVEVNPETTSAPSGDFSLVEPSVGLEGLQSYQQSLQTSFEGGLDGEQMLSTSTLTRRVVDDPPTQFFWIESSGQPTQFFGRVGGVDYQQPSPEMACFASPVSDTNPQPLSAAFPLASLPPVTGAVFVNEETVNGISAKHYTFDESSIGFGDSVTAQGELWVASAGNYLVRYTLRLDAPVDVLGPGVEGVQSWTYQLTDVNTAQSNLPEMCQQLLAEITVPMLDNAVLIQQLPGYLVYQAPGGLEAALAFYQQQAEALGWVISTPYPFEDTTRITLRPADDSLIQLSFTPEDEQLLVTVQTLAPLPAE